MASVGIRIGFATTCCALGLQLAKPAYAEAPPLTAYGDLPAVEEVAISPSGRSLAILSQINGQRSLGVLDSTKGWRLNAPVGDIKVRDLAWAGEDLVLMTKSDSVALGQNFLAARYELTSVIVVPLATGQVRAVFKGSNSVAAPVMGSFGIREIDGHWTGYFGGIKTNVTRMNNSQGNITLNPDLMRVDLVGGTIRTASAAAAQDHRRDWLVDGSGAVSVTFDLNKSNGKWTITNASGTVLTSGTSLAGDAGLIGFGKEGSSVVYMFDIMGDRKLFEIPLTGGTPTEPFKPDEVTRFLTDNTNSRLLGYVDRADPLKLRFFDPTKQSAYARSLRAFPGRRAEAVAWTPDFSKLVIHTSGNSDSGSWYLVDIAQRKADPIGTDRPAIANEAVGPISSVEYSASDGLTMNGVLTLPPAREAKNLPVIIIPHDGPSARDEVMFNWQAQAFASRGYAVFQPNYRGSSGSDEAFRLAGKGQLGRKIQTDISDGLAELARRGIVDPKRACIVGTGFGGYAALAGVTVQQGLYRCAVAVAPIADLGQFQNTNVREAGFDPIVLRNLRELLGASAGFAEISPRKRAAQADAPILLIHGKEDVCVPFAQSQAMADALKDAGKPYELIVLREEDHWLSRAATRQQMLEAAMAFVEKNNPAN